MTEIPTAEDIIEEQKDISNEDLSKGVEEQNTINEIWKQEQEEAKTFFNDSDEDIIEIG